MIEKANQVVNILKKKQKQIATMESCTGGGLANIITNIEGASQILKFSAVTYSNEFKIKMGVPKETIDQYTVYSIETACAMAKAISAFSYSDYGVGITGKLNCSDPQDETPQDDIVYLAIYDKKQNIFHKETIQVNKKSRIENKNFIIEKTLEILEQIL